MGQALQRLRAVPLELKRLMEIANSLPPEMELPDFSDAITEVSKDLQDAPDGRKLFVAAAMRFFERFNEPGLLASLRRAPLEKIQRVVLEYERVRRVREILRAIAETKIELPPMGLDEMIRTTMDEKGRIRFEIGSIPRALEGVEADRIRRCAVCGMIFWAGRKDQRTCSKQHANVLRVRQHREKEGPGWETEQREKRRKKWNEAYLDSYKQQRYKKQQNARH